MLQRVLPDGSPSAAPVGHRKPKSDGSTSILSSRIRPGATIILDQKGQHSLFRIQEGCIALYQTLHDGRRQILDILGPGRLFGKGVTDQLDCVAEALAFTRLELLRESNAAFRHESKSAMLQVMHRLQTHVVRLGRMTATEKVAAAILDLADQFGKRRGSLRPAKTTFCLYLTRSDLADWLGLTMETVSRVLNTFRRSGLIAFSTPELVTVNDAHRLREIADASACV